MELMGQIGTKMGPNWDHVGAKMIAIGTETGLKWDQQDYNRCKMRPKETKILKWV